MKIALVDVDGRNFPNLALMKLSDWAESLDEWRVVRDPEQYGGTPAVLMKR